MRHLFRFQYICFLGTCFHKLAFVGLVSDCLTAARMLSLCIPSYVWCTVPLLLFIYLCWHHVVPLCIQWCKVAFFVYLFTYLTMYFYLVDLMLFSSGTGGVGRCCSLVLASIKWDCMWICLHSVAPGRCDRHCLHQSWRVASPASCQSGLPQLRAARSARSANSISSRSIIIVFISTEP